MRKYIMFSIPIIVNMVISVICIWGNKYGGWLRYGGSAAIQVVANGIILPTYMVIVVGRQMRNNERNNIYPFVISYVVMKICLFYDLLNAYLFGGAMDSVYWLIFNTERALNSIILIVGWIIIILSRYIKNKIKKQNQQADKRGN